MATPLQSILVTGASTGIGRAIALDLAEEGHQVFASVRKPEDATALESANKNIIGLLFDVTDEAGVQKGFRAARERREAGRPFSIINNAGIAVPGPIEDIPLADLRRQFEVNVFGAIRVTQVFLPLVRENKGRIVNMSSVAGLVTTPFLGVYSSSKFALEALSDALRRELAAEGIKVLLIEPGLIATPIWNKGLEGPRPQISEHYQQPLGRFLRSIERSVKSALPVEVVSEAVRRALFEDEPPARQVVAALPLRLQIGLEKVLPTKWADKLMVKHLFGR